MTTASEFPTRRGGEGDTIGERRVGWHGDHEHGFHRLCEVEVREESRPVPGRPGVASGGPLYCANDASIIWVDTYNGAVEVMCADHVPDPDDEELKPVESYQSSRWEIIDYTDTHPLTRHTPVAMKDCPEAALRRAEAVAARLVEYDALPKTWEVGPGFMGSREDEQRLREAGEQTAFPYIPESMREHFGGAGTIMEWADQAGPKDARHD